MQTREDQAFWRARAEQLQQALDSRIVIEQAKGILSERFGLGIEGAFGLLRHGARSQRMKIHLLARAVVDTPDTPDPIVSSLAQHADTFISVPRDERVVRTEELYKRLNEKIATLLDGGSPTFLCECGNPLCNEPIELPRGRFADVALARRLLRDHARPRDPGSRNGRDGERRIRDRAEGRQSAVAHARGVLSGVSDQAAASERGRSTRTWAFIASHTKRYPSSSTRAWSSLSDRGRTPPSRVRSSTMPTTQPQRRRYVASAWVAAVDGVRIFIGTQTAEGRSSALSRTASGSAPHPDRRRRAPG